MDNKILSKSFLWMAIGLLVTFATGFLVCLNERMIYSIFGRAYYLFIILEFVVVIFLSARITKMQPTTAKIAFLLYAFISGLTFSSIFLVYEISSILYIFLIAAGIYGLFAFIGYNTKLDLSKLGTFLFIGLIIIIIASIINLFITNDTFSLILCILGLALFLGTTAYDIQKIKNMVDFPNAPIYGALEFYLDFINIFIRLLELFGKRRD